jgi:SAM-dependent methyltransferase
MDVDPRWYETFFEGDWLDFLALRAEPERTSQQVDFVVEQLGLEPGARLLDAPCGHGRHSLELARRGMRVTGVDLSPRSLQLARDAAGEEGLDVELVESDLRDLPWDGEFDAAINLFTSFGYLPEQAEDERALAAIARALRPGGGFLIDVINPTALFRGYRAQAWEELDGGVLFIQHHEYDHLRGRNLSTWTFVRPDGERSEIRHSLRVYSAAELTAMLGRAGLEVDGSWGGFDGAKLDLDSWRLVLRSRKSGG